MDRNTGSTDPRNARASEDNTEAVEHVQNAAENRDALAAQARRTEATAPDSADQPIRGMGNENASEDTTRGEEAMRAVEENRDALEAQNRRVEATAPPEVNRDLRDQR